MKINKYLFEQTKSENLQEYISRLETMYECVRLMHTTEKERIKEMNRQCGSETFLNL